MKKKTIAIIMTLAMTAALVQPTTLMAAEGTEPAAPNGDSIRSGEAAEDDLSLEEPSNDGLQPLGSEGEMYAVDGVIGGKVQFDTSTGTVTWMQNSVTEAVIPDTIDGVEVVAIGDWATPQRETFTRLVLPESVTGIGQGVGQNSGLTEVSIPSGVTTLSKYCFRGCNSLESVTIPGTVKTLENCCFQNCTALKTVTLQEGVEEIGQNAFQGCSELVTLSLPASLKKIDNYAFRYCDILEFVTYGGKDFYPFDGGVKGLTLGNYCFGGCFFGHPDFSNSYKTGKWYKQLHEVTPTGDYMKDIMAIAESQLGYHEGNSLSQMDGAHNGDDDYSEYCYWWNEPGEMWCGEYAAWCLAMASVPYEVVEPKYQTKDKDGEELKFAWSDTAYAGGSYELKTGDVILFKYKGGNHVILVKSVSRNGNTVKVESINGNHSNNVSNDSYSIDAATGKTTDEWVSKDGYVDAVYAPDYSFLSGLKYYTVSFDPQGGSAAWTSKKLTNNASYGLMPLPVRNGYTFDGWYTEANGGQKITSYRRVRLNGNQILYAHWKEGSGPDQPVEPEEPEEQDYSKWGFDESTGTITRIPYDWTGGALPEVIDGVTVKAIGNSACSGREKVTSLIVPASVKSIGRYAFNACYELEDVKFLGDVSKIQFGRGAFQSTLFMRPDFSPAYKRGEYYKKLMSVELTGDYIKDTLAIAASQDGYHEGDSISEMDGTNRKGKNDYAEMAYFTCSPTYKWWPYEQEQYQYGGWCGNYCNWCMSMASIPEELHGWWMLDDDECPRWSDTVYAGGEMGYTLKAGDVLKMNIGHLCLVTKAWQEGGIVYVETWNGNHENDVQFETYELRASDGYNLGYARDYPSKTQDNGERYQVKWIVPAFPEKLAEVTFYNVRFDANGGILPPGKATKKYAASAYYGIMPIPEKKGSRFDGWYTEAEGGRKVTAYHKTLLTSDITLYAHWSESSIDEGSGSGADPTPRIETIGDELNTWLVTGQSLDIGEGTWKSANTSVAAVKKTGIITAKKAGKTTVTGTKLDGTELTCNVTVASPSVRSAAKSILVGETTAMSVAFGDADPAGYNVSWTSANPAVAVVDDTGNVTGTGKGSAVINAWIGGKAFSAKISVTDNAASLNPKKLQYGSLIRLNPFQSYAPKYRTPDGAAFQVKNAAWGYCEDPDADVTKEAKDFTPVEKKGKVVAYTNGIVEITASNGKIKAVGPGQTTIYGIDADKKNMTSLTVLITEVPSRSVIYLTAGKSVSLGFPGVKPALAEYTLESEGGDEGCLELVKKKDSFTGAVKALPDKSGSARVTCSYLGFTWSALVYAQDPSLEADGTLTLNNGTSYALTLNEGESYEIKTKGIYEPVVWKSSKNGIAFADAGGTVHALSKGTANLTAKIGGKAFKISVTVP